MKKVVSDYLEQNHQDNQPSIQFADELETQLRQHHQILYGQEVASVKPQFSYRLTSLVAGCVLTLIFVATVPPIRAATLSLLESLFNRADSNQQTVTQNSDEMATFDPENIELAQLDDVAGFDVKLPANIPDGYELSGSIYDADRYSTTLSYEAPGRGLMITQQPLDRTTYGLLTDGTLGIGASAPVILTTVGDYSGEYVTGTWIVDESNPDGDDNTLDIYWNEDVSFRALRWIQDDMIFQILAMGGSEGHRYIGQNEMINIALSLE